MMSPLTIGPLKIDPTGSLGALTPAGAGDSANIPDATWYTAHKPGDGLIYRFDAGEVAPVETEPEYPGKLF